MRRPPTSPRYGIVRVISKKGLASRKQALQWVSEGRVRVNGRIVRDPESPTRLESDVVSIDGREALEATRVYLMLNKPRGLVTTAADETGRETVYTCFQGADLPWIAPVGRLDKASEGLLLFSNDPEWASGITDSSTDRDVLVKVYHVQIDRIPNPELLSALVSGVDAGEHLSASNATILRTGSRNAWLEISLREGRNRQIRRLLAAFDIAVLRLVRVAIGDLLLGNLPKGEWRHLSQNEVRKLSMR